MTATAQKRPGKNGHGADPYAAKVPPHNADAERCALGCILLDDSCFPIVDAILGADDFYDYRHRMLYQQIEAIRSSGGVVDTVIVAESLIRAGMLDEAGGLVYLQEVVEEVAHVVHADSYAKIVREHSQKRAVINAARKALEAAYDPTSSIDRMVGALDISESISRGTAERFTSFTAAALDAGDFEIEYPIPGILAAGIPTIVGGAFKTLKTSVAADLHFSLSTGAKFLGQFPVRRPYRTAFMSGESGLSALQGTYRRIANSRGWSLNRVENFIITPDLPRLSEPQDLRMLVRFIEDRFVEGTEILLVDPAYLALSLGDDAGNLFRVGEQLRPLSDIGQQTGCTIVIVHHFRKASAAVHEPAELSDLQWSGFAEWAGQWMLLSRRSKYEADSNGEHQLWMNCGGRPGHSCLWAVDVEEGRQESERGRYWQVVVKSAAQARAEAAEAEHDNREGQRELKQQTEAERDREKIIKVMKRFQNGETKTTIREAANISSKRATAALLDLEESGIVEQCEIEKANGQKYPGYMFSRVHPDSPGFSGCPGGHATHPDFPPLGESGVCGVRPPSPDANEESGCPGDSTNELMGGW